MSAATWIDEFVEQLKKAGVKGIILEAAKYETIGKLAHDPWAAPASASSAAASSSNKRARDGAPEHLVGDEAEKKIKEMVAIGKWQLVTAESKRANTGAYVEKYGPFSVKIMDFILDGTERSTFEWKETIKAAGFIHYSGSDRAGWTPFSLPGGKKGQGKEVKDPVRLERFAEAKIGGE